MSKAIQVVDDFGAWDVIGAKLPIYDNFVEYPDYTTSVSETTRLTYGGELQGFRSYGYLRVRYELGISSIFGEWVRIYPGDKQELIRYPHPPEFGDLKTNPRRFWQIQKKHWNRFKVGTLIDSEWNVKIEVCSPLILDLPSEPETQSTILGLT